MQTSIEKLLKEFSEIICNADNLFDINEFKCVPTCNKLPAIEYASSQSSKICFEDNTQCEVFVNRIMSSNINSDLP